MKSIKYILSITFMTILLSTVNQSCTNLDEELYSELDGATFFDDPDNLIFAFGTAYTNLYWTMGHKYALGRDCGTDILAVPQRGGDWFDGGEWHRYHRLTWTPSDFYVEFWWNLMYKGINTCNSLIFQFEAVGTEEADIAIAELRAFRALYYYWLIDVYGNVPIVTDFDVPADFAPATNSRKEVYDFIEKEITEVKDQLSKETGLATYGRVNYYVAQMILAKLYINAEVFTGTPQWAKAEAALDEIINSNKFQLATNYFDNFQSEGQLSPEIIMGVPFDEINAQGLEIHLFSLHYNLQEKLEMQQLPWNGLCVQEGFFNSFAEEDARREGMLFGKQYNKDGTQIEDPGYEKFDPTNPTAPRDLDGAGLNLTPEINELEPNCLRQAGARIYKWKFAPNSDRYLSNDFPIFRYADVLLMKAEVQLRTGGGNADTYVNMVRQRAGVEDFTGVTMEQLLAERGRELFVEGYRRNDLIRFGKYLDARWEKEEVSPEYTKLWPIPGAQINSNLNLIQNPGY